jgi:hypothetical protein
VTHIYNPNYSRGEEWKEKLIEVSMSKKLMRFLSQEISQTWWHAPVVPGVQEA